MLQRIAADENLHMIFYRNLCGAALDLRRTRRIEAIAEVVENFQMPGAGMPNFRRNGVLMAKHGIYDLRQHLEEVVLPELPEVGSFERTDFSGRGEQTREELGDLSSRTSSARRSEFEEQRDRALAREAARRESRAG